MVVFSIPERARLIGLICVLIGVTVLQIVWDRPRQTEERPWWETQIRAFEARDMTNPPPKDAVLIVGSSSVRLWNTAKQTLGPYEIIKRGFGGSCISDVVYYADRILLPYEPRVVIVYAGDNDVAARKMNERILNDFKTLVDTIHRELPETRIGFISIKPSRARWKLKTKIKRVNAAIKAYADATPLVTYIDVFNPMLDSKGNPRADLLAPDGLHLSGKGYELWTTEVKQYLNRVTHPEISE